MNRKERRAMGFTEARFRKMDLEESPETREWLPFYSYSRSEGDTTAQRRQRLDGNPRRWQTERARRISEQIERIVP